MDYPEKLAASLPYLASDLEWVIRSPFLLHEKPEPDLSEHPQSQKLIEDIKRDPGPLADYLLQIRRHTLGTYFEYLVYFWLDNLDDVHLHGTNIQLREEKQTLGELDLLFRYQGQDYHWELAVKFYALAGDSANTAHWFGPLKKDTLKRKLDRLFTHQLPILKTPAGISHLKDLELTSVKSFPFLKGRLFTHAYDQRLLLNYPAIVSEHCAQGLWLERSELYRLPRLPELMISRRPKVRWFSELPASKWHNAHSFKDLSDFVDETLGSADIPVQVSLGRKEGDAVMETTRLFVMPDGWRPSF